MIGLDTSVLLRYLLQDDPAQASTATVLIEGLSSENPGYVSVVTLVETIWVMRRGRKKSEDEIRVIVSMLVDAAELVFQHEEEIRRVLTIGTAALADSLIAALGAAAGCDHTVTFDRRAAKLPGMLLLD